MSTTTPAAESPQVEASVTSLLDGLTEAQVAERVRSGQVNEVPATTTRTVGQIVLANVFTPFNLLLGGLLAIILVVGPLQDALFGGVIVANIVIGVYQEVRAKRTLDRLTVLTAPKAHVIRAGTVRDIPVGQVVLDDVIELEPGAQVVVDGVVLTSNGLEVDESLLTGESDPVVKGPGDEVLSGSFVAAGGGRFRATRIGAAAYARSIADEARTFAPVRSELRDGVNRIVKIIGILIVPTGILLAYSQFRSSHDVSEAIRGAVAGTVAMVPEGLALLTSVALALAVTRLGRRGVLVQEMPAVEGLARVDLLCIDKTGTLTEGRLVVDAVEHAEGSDPEATRRALAALAGADPNPNATMRAIAEAHPLDGAGWPVAGSVPFSSARKWSAYAFDGQGTWILGAPEVLLATDAIAQTLRARVNELADTGSRVLLLQRCDAPLAGEVLPTGRSAAALVLLQDRIRPDAGQTMRYFAEQGVGVKVISGDSPRTVAAVAAQAGIEGAEAAVDARELPTDPLALGEALERSTIFGRVVPRQKQAMVGALKAREHVVAMTGDGVNDVLALKDADIGIAMGSGSDASRSVAKLVLVDGQFSAMPSVVGEGRQVIANIERSAKLFLTKTIYAMLLAIGVGVLSFPFPFLPRHLTLIGTLTIGVPGFVLTLERYRKRAEPGFVRRVMAFSVPAGIMAAIATFVAYAWVYEGLDRPLGEARTAATVSLFLIGAALVYLIARPLSRADLALLSGMVGAFVACLVVPGLRRFFALPLPSLLVLIGAVAIAAAVAVAVQLMIPGRLAPPADPGEEESPGPG